MNTINESCWEGYKQVGMKEKNGKMVPNCVPISEDETQDKEELMIGDYQTRHFDICPGATSLYSTIEDKNVDMDLAERTAKMQDVLFYLEKHTVEEMKKATEEDVKMAENLRDQIMKMAEMMGLEKEHSYIDSHVEAIEKLANKSQGRTVEVNGVTIELGRVYSGDPRVKAFAPIDEGVNMEDEIEEVDEYCKACLAKVMIEAKKNNYLEEAEYRGRKVKLNKPMRGDVKKFKVFVKDPKTGNIKKVNFGDKKMRIKKSNPKRRKSFRARHNCDNPGPKTKARYWSCRKW